MRSYHYTVLVIAIGLAIGILYIVRRDHLYIRQGLFWIAIAVFSLLFGAWPYLIDVMGRLLGIAYPPTLLFLVAIVVLVLKGAARRHRAHQAAAGFAAAESTDRAPRRGSVVQVTAMTMRFPAKR